MFVSRRVVKMAHRTQHHGVSIHQGSCLCGVVHFEVTSELHPRDACHCSQLRKQSGQYWVSTNVAYTDLNLHGAEHLTLSPQRINGNSRGMSFSRRKPEFRARIQTISPEKTLVLVAIQAISPEQVLVFTAIQTLSPGKMLVLTAIQTLSPGKMEVSGSGGLRDLR